MKLLLLMCFILVVIGICVWSYYAVCKEYGFGPWAEKTALHEYQEHKALYFNYAADYANFSEIVWCCAQAIGSSGNLMPPSEPKAIFCQRAIERVSLANGRITFASTLPFEARQTAAAELLPRAIGLVHKKKGPSILTEFVKANFTAIKTDDDWSAFYRHMNAISGFLMAGGDA